MSMRGLVLLVAASGGAWCAPLRAGCSVSAQPVAFDAYQTTSPAPTDGTGSIAVTCTNDAPVQVMQSYTIALSEGASGGYNPRRLTGSSSNLDYNLYRDVTRLQVWGNGTGGTFTVADSALLLPLASVARTYAVYGRVPPLQNAAAGGYTDTILVTVNY